MAESFSVVGGMGCKKQSWSPEVISLYGDADTVNQKLANMEMDLPERRVYIFTVETENELELSFFERTSAGRVNVLKWSGGRGADIHQQIHQEIVRNRGVNCVGEQTKALIAKLPGATSEPEAAAPVNAKAAFSHQIRNQRKDAYIKTTVYLMC
jgi:hypothetical protein